MNLGEKRDVDVEEGQIGKDGVDFMDHPNLLLFFEG